MIWYPYEQMKTMKPPYEIVDAAGVYLYTKEGKNDRLHLLMVERDSRL